MPSPRQSEGIVMFKGGSTLSRLWKILASVGLSLTMVAVVASPANAATRWHIKYCGVGDRYWVSWHDYGSTQEPVAIGNNSSSSVRAYYFAEGASRWSGTVRAHSHVDVYNKVSTRSFSGASVRFYDTSGNWITGCPYFDRPN